MSDIFSGWMASRAQEQTNKINREMAQDQMRFQERMSSTAHQREVNDLRLAGLNPILSAGGGGSSTPSGAVIPAQSPGDPLGEGLVSSAASVGRLALERKAVLADTELKQQTKQTERYLTEDARNRSVISGADAFSAANRMRAEQAAPRVLGAMDAWTKRLMPIVNTMTGMGVGVGLGRVSSALGARAADVVRRRPAEVLGKGIAW